MLPGWIGGFTAKLGRMSTDETSKTPLLERILAYATITIIVVALGSFFLTLIIGLADREAISQGLWQFVYNTSLFALPIGFVLLITLLIVSQVRRSRETRQKKR